MTERQKVYAHREQLKVQLVNAYISILLWGRATGKTTGAQAPWLYHRAVLMPRSLGALIATSYTQLMERVIPGLMKGWGRMGLKQDVHYHVGRFAPKSWNVPKPYHCPVSADHMIHWNNGSAQAYVSQDRPSMSGGFEFDYGTGDEARFLDFEKLSETLLAVRGNKIHFGHLAEHGSLLFSSDRPTDSRGNWLYDLAEQCDSELIELILACESQLREWETEPAGREADIRKVKLDLISFRKKAVYFSEASTLENVDALGIDVIDSFKKTLTPFKFRRSVLNERVRGDGEGFYKALNPRVHAYRGDSNYEFFGSPNFTIGSRPDCRWYRKIEQGELHIGCDFNSYFNCVVTVQLVGKEIRAVSVLHTTGNISDLAEKWCDFFSYHNPKQVVHHYNHTAVSKDAEHRPMYAKLWSDAMRKAGWKVRENRFGQTAGHEVTARNWDNVLRGEGEYIFRYHGECCEDLEISMLQTGVRTDKDGFNKDKRSERRKSVAFHESTHIPEAADCVLQGILSLKRSRGNYGLTTIVG